MTTLVIELQDPCVTAIRDGAVVLESPGYAVIDNGAIQVGSEAFSASRLNPRLSSSRFWDRLSMDLLPENAAQGRNYADLAYAHLDAIWREAGADASDVIIVVPGSFSREQLGLLLGIAGEIGIPVTGLVDAAVAAMSQTHGEGRLIHIDALLHRVVLTEIDASDALTRVAVNDSNRSGLVKFRDRWGHCVSDAFVSNTRFDPMHSAATEQALYNGVDEWLESFKGNSQTEITLEAAGKTHRVSMTRERMAKAVETLYAELLGFVESSARIEEGVTIALSHRVASFPEFSTWLAASIPQSSIVELEPQASAHGAESHASFIRTPGGHLSFVTSLPRDTGAVIKPARQAAGAESQSTGGVIDDDTPTHFVMRSRLYPISDSPFELGVESPANGNGVELGQLKGVSRRHCALKRGADGVILEDSSTFGTFVNGQRVDGTTELRAGDRVRIGSPGVTLELVRLVG